MGDRNANSADLALVRRLAGRPTGPRVVAELQALFYPVSPLGRLADYLLNDLDDFLTDEPRLAPEIQGRRTGPVQKGEPPAR